MSEQTEKPNQPSEEEIQAQLESSKRMMNVLLLMIGGGVIGVLVFGIYQMVMIAVENS